MDMIMLECGCLWIHTPEQAAVFENEKSKVTQVVRSPIYPVPPPPNVGYVEE